MPLVAVGSPADNVAAAPRIEVQRGIVAEAELEVVAQILRVGDGDEHLLEILERVLGQPAVEGAAVRGPHLVPHIFGSEDGIVGHQDGLSREGVAFEDVDEAGDEGVVNGVAGNVVFVGSNGVFPIGVSHKDGVAGGVSELEDELVVKLRGIAHALPLHGRGLATAAAGLVVEAEIERVADIHRPMVREVAVQAYGLGGQRVGGEGLATGLGIYPAMVVDGVHRDDPDARGVDGEGVVHKSQTVLPFPCVGVTDAHGEVLHKGQRQGLAVLGGTGLLFRGFRNDGVARQPCHILLAVGQEGQTNQDAYEGEQSMNSV